MSSIEFDERARTRNSKFPEFLFGMYRWYYQNQPKI